ncbi:hypothetical protein SDRG_03496 [Saprolegnia diclina VS20]|uniref:EF-hand domain-containing protein n=1 Tax=Saprolegnia diclina (strain VS20) TaxID=1156394 RepID=T0QYX9_SAPDV|nr:hypothetical protein SDRG_03496 [Saprolegnia diclina VS20]EQC39290.1 hypothetical protein SDRG_03496 [Saprolegnia diclina VS20]|eukprot:XP_008607351.1 hypothetical protein SDRG_03496 [Saprolegnia diclina VS20]
MRPARTPRRGVPNERVLRSATPRSHAHPATPRLPTPRPSSATPDPEIEVILPKLKVQGAVDVRKTQPCLSARLVPRLQVAIDKLDKARNRPVDHGSPLLTKARFRQCFDEVAMDNDERVFSSDIDMLFMCLDTEGTGTLQRGAVSRQLEHLNDHAHFHTRVAAPPVHTEKKLSRRQRPTTRIYEQASFELQAPPKQTARSLAW